MATVGNTSSPMVRLDSQPENLMGSTDLDDVSDRLPSQVDALHNEGQKSVSNGSQSHRAFNTGTENNAGVPPPQSEVKPNNKGVPW